MRVGNSPELPIQRPDESRLQSASPNAINCIRFANSGFSGIDPAWANPETRLRLLKALLWG
jgi:hypothetical protein